MPPPALFDALDSLSASKALAADKFEQFAALFDRQYESAAARAKVDAAFELLSKRFRIRGAGPATHCKVRGVRGRPRRDQEFLMSHSRRRVPLYRVIVCIVRRQPRETVGVKRPFPHRLGDGSNLGPCPHIRGPFGVRSRCRVGPLALLLNSFMHSEVLVGGGNFII